jgi:predicted nucleic acid-binding protein
MEDQTSIPEFLHNSTLLLDTNFFIDAYRQQNQYGGFIKKLKNSGVAFVSPNFVKYEFIRSKTIDVVREKEKYFYGIIDNILPYGPEIDRLIVPTVEEYKQYMENLPLTDLILAAYLKKYKGLYLLTRDHNDFPTTVFKREFVFNMEEFGEKIYGIYSYRPEKMTLKEEVASDDIPF